MALQVVWNRTLVCVVENNTTSFSLILASVLLGAALGTVLYVPLAGWVRGAQPNIRLFFAVELTLALFVLGSLPLLNRLYDVAAAISAWHPVRSIADLCFDRWLVAMVPTVPASAAAAFLLPVLMEGWRRCAATVGSRSRRCSPPTRPAASSARSPPVSS